MLIDFSVKNFRSFKEKQVFSLVKTATAEMEETNSFYIGAPADTSLVRGAALYGPNGAGKSNFIEAIRVFQEIVRDSSRESSAGDKLELVPFRLSTDTENKPSEFEANFIVDKVRYQFGFIADQHRILEEWLIAYPNRRPQSWYERTYEKDNFKWEFGSKFTGPKQTWANATRENALFLSTAVQLNNEQLMPIYNWIVHFLKVSRSGTWGFGFTSEMCSDKETKKLVLDFLTSADIDIVDIETEKKEMKIDSIFPNVSESALKELESQVTSWEYDEIKTARYNNVQQKVFFDFETESLGTRKLFALAGPWIDSLENGNTLFIDEMHDSFHPKLIEYLVSLFHDPKTNPLNAQLIFTTHETSILNQDIFRRDQIWFVERAPLEGSTLIPLTDFKVRKGNANIEAAYLAGRFGAIPHVGRKTPTFVRSSNHKESHS